jgi:osmotically-inducible protein OsmY
VQSERLKDRVTEIAREASTKTKFIQNELEVAGKTSLIARGNDAWIATKVRTLMFADKTVPSDQVRVVAENGAVFLMGLVHREEGAFAGNLARNVAGVTKVVEVFEYLD